ncbi:MAG: FKBP-type peptidyl-prolyl cis-trans isomerase [Saprospiraceae bacterium]
MKYSIILSMLIFFLASSCQDRYDPIQQHLDDIEEIEEYLEENNLTGFQKTESGVFYKILDEGEGEEHPSSTSSVNCDYIGLLIDDNRTYFDGGTKVDFPLTGVIKGWQDGIPKLKREGEGEFYIPSTLAYGNQSRGTIIGRNEILYFKIKLYHFWD